jgi:hypothetical protein
MATLKWSWQTPERRALERDEDAIARWKRSEWPRIKNAQRLGAHLAFLDESGFLLVPNVRKTWAAVGQTPILRHSYRRDRISTISSLTVSPARTRLGLYVQFHPTNITGVEVIGFLRYLLRHVRGPVVPLWDGGPIHRRAIVRDFVREQTRLHVHRFPAYAPELNPDEFVWVRLRLFRLNAMKFGE